MFSFGHSGGTSTSVDPELPRDPPPEATVVYFPQNDVEITQKDEWPRPQTDLFNEFASVTKPSLVNKSYIEALNVSIKNDVELEDLIPDAHDSGSHLPPKSWTQGLDPALRKASVLDVHAHHNHQTPLILSNAARAPTREDFTKFARELACCTEDGIRVIARRTKTKNGRILPNINHARDFWTKLEQLSQYWDTSQDSYFTAIATAPSKPPVSPKAIRSFLSTATTPRRSSLSSDGPKRQYTGFRKSNGSKMPDTLRTDTARSLIRYVTQQFHCDLSSPPPSKAPKLAIGKLAIPVTQSAIVWRKPEDRDQLKRGVLEGPVCCLQARHEVYFANNPNKCALDMAREVACLLQIAQQRAREGKPRYTPGAGAWYTSVPRWGGGPGGEFGESEGNSDAPASRLTTAPGGFPRRRTEEEIWKDLSPGASTFEIARTYCRVGRKSDAEGNASKGDTVFLISMLFHHIAIIRLDVSSSYLEYITWTGTVEGDKLHKTGTQTAAQSLHQDEPGWNKPHVWRSPWFDLLTPEGRLEAFRGIWGVVAWAMRVEAEPSVGKTSGTVGNGVVGHAGRQKSEAGGFLGRRKSVATPAGAALGPQRSHSVAF